jgi:hypothetical protein
MLSPGIGIRTETVMHMHCMHRQIEPDRSGHQLMQQHRGIQSAGKTTDQPPDTGLGRQLYLQELFQGLLGHRAHITLFKRKLFSANNTKKNAGNCRRFFCLKHQSMP